MSDPTPYVHFAGNAREALTFYADVFGGVAQLHTFEQFGRTDGPPEAIAHGQLTDGPVTIFGADAAGDEPSVRCEGLMLALLGTAPPDIMRAWFTKLSQGSHVIDALQRRPWGDTDGQVVDRYGLHWLIGFQGDG